MGNFLSMEKTIDEIKTIEIKTPCKKVSFDIFNDVIIIPNYQEMHEHIKKIWWTHFELHLFRQNAFNELHIFYVNNPKMTIKHIQNLLYQPNYENIKSLFYDTLL